MLRDIFKNDVGTYNPQAEKLGIKGFLCFLGGLILSIGIPIALVYLEAWEATPNLENLIWGEKANLRVPYFILFCCTNIVFFEILLFLCSTYRINGYIYRLKRKIVIRPICGGLYLISIMLYIIANIIY